MTSSESPTHPDAPRAGGETQRWLDALDDAIGTADAEANDVTQKARFRSAGRDTAAALRELRASLLERHRDGELWAWLESLPCGITLPADAAYPFSASCTPKGPGWMREFFIRERQARADYAARVAGPSPERASK